MGVTYGGQISVQLTLVDVALQPGEAERAEELLGHGEAREQALEVVPGGQLRKTAAQLGLGRAGWAQQQQMLAAQRGQQHQPHFRVALNQPILHRVHGGADAIRQLVRKPYLLGTSIGGRGFSG